MFKSEINAVLTLIALSIFADKRVLSTEITAFVSSAEKLQVNLNSSISLTETKLLLWFEMNRADIREKMTLSPHEFKAWFDMILEELPILPNKNFIFDIIESISQADGELHISEKALYVMLERKFKLPA